MGGASDGLHGMDGGEGDGGFEVLQCGVVRIELPTGDGRRDGGGDDDS